MRAVRVRAAVGNWNVRKANTSMSDSVNSTKDLPETGITPGGTTGAFRDVLSKDHARRGKPPLHFADMAEDERIAKAKDLDFRNSESSSLPIITMGISTSLPKSSLTFLQRNEPKPQRRFSQRSLPK